MKCEHCDRQMQRETVVRVLRIGAFGRTRAVVQPGWHCWTCKTTRNDLPMPSRARVGVARRGLAALAGAVTEVPRHLAFFCTQPPRAGLGGRAANL